jgi:hypothetical protein
MRHWVAWIAFASGCGRLGQAYKALVQLALYPNCGITHLTKPLGRESNSLMTTRRSTRGLEAKIKAYNFKEWHIVLRYFNRFKQASLFHYHFSYRLRELVLTRDLFFEDTNMKWIFLEPLLSTPDFCKFHDDTEYSKASKQYQRIEGPEKLEISSKLLFLIS